MLKQNNEDACLPVHEMLFIVIGSRNTRVALAEQPRCIHSQSLSAKTHEPETTVGIYEAVLYVREHYDGQLTDAIPVHGRSMV